MVQVVDLVQGRQISDWESSALILFFSRFDGGGNLHCLERGCEFFCEWRQHFSAEVFNDGGLLQLNVKILAQKGNISQAGKMLGPGGNILGMGLAGFSWLKMIPKCFQDQIDVTVGVFPRAPRP